MMNTMMKITAAAAIMLAAGKAHALGATYAQECAAYGGRGTVDQKNHVIVWHYNKHYIVEAFVHNRCVMMFLKPDSGLVYTISDTQRILALNAGPNQLWQPYDDASHGFTQAWATSDDTIYAGLTTNGCVRVCYKWWLQGKGLADPPVTDNYGEAPVEDVPNTPGNADNPVTITKSHSIPL
jgi:hypothetical protein